MISHFSYREKYEEASRQAGQFMGAWRETLDAYDKAMSVLKEANELLRSAHTVADREGRETGWSAFKAQIAAALKKQHKMLHDYYADESVNAPPPKD